MSSFLCDSGQRRPRWTQTSIRCASVMLPSFLFCILNSHIYKRKLLFNVRVSENICVAPKASKLMSRCLMQGLHTCGVNPIVCRGTPHTCVSS